MNDTIAAIASGMTASGIGIIRISGPEAFAVLKRIFLPGRAADREEGEESGQETGRKARGETGGENDREVRRADPSVYRANTIHYGRIRDPGTGEIIDECLVMVMRAPRSYTTEDTVEINSHGGPYVMRRILETVTRSGARPAEPGEFTKRAYLGGRIDLSEAEAVMDVISASSDDALKASLMQLSGSVRNRIGEIRGKIMNELAYIEAALDDPEHMDLTGYPEELREKLIRVMEEIEGLSSTFGEGRIIREGILTVIIGKPNAGKSSLLNALTGEDRAIVTEIEGTTRDILEEKIRIGGMLLRIIDTAGIRDARDQIERIGIGRAREYAGQADLILAVFDSASALDENDREILRLIRGKQAIVLLNKSDLPVSLREEELRRAIDEETGEETGAGTGAEPDAGTEPGTGQGTEPGAKDTREDTRERVPIIRISAREMTGLRELESVIRNKFFSGNLRFGEETLITNVRHFNALKRAGESLRLVSGSIEQGLPEDFFSIDLMDAYSALGEIIGEEVDDDLINTIFSQFCMGK